MQAMEGLSGYPAYAEQQRYLSGPSGPPPTQMAQPPSTTYPAPQSFGGLGGIDYRVR
jgi:hypothetical protein